MSRVRVLFDPSHSASCGGVVEARDDAARDRLAWDVYLLRCTRVDKGQSRRGSPGAHGRGRPWHPLGSDPRSLCARLEVFRASCQIGRVVRNGKCRPGGLVPEGALT